MEEHFVVHREPHKAQTNATHRREAKGQDDDVDGTESSLKIGKLMYNILGTSGRPVQFNRTALNVLYK